MFVQQPQSNQPSRSLKAHTKEQSVTKLWISVRQILQLRRDPVYDFAWLRSETGTEVMTVSSDGRVLW